MATHIDRYEIKNGLGRGAMGSVYLAFDPKVGREVAVKVLSEDYAKSPKHRQRFEREARAIAALHHPNIVEIYDYSTSSDGLLYLVMEYVQGPHLGRFIASNGAMPEVVATAVCHELAAALDHAHKNGVIHRDIKPENVFLDRGRLVLADFGIVKAIAPENPFGPDAASPRTDIIGTPGFMAPEQLEQKPLDARTDIFALGALIYYLTSHKLAFEAESPYSLLKNMKSSPPEALDRIAQVSRELAKLVEESLALNPDKRPPTADAVRARLRKVLRKAGITDTRDLLKAYELDPRGVTERAGANRRRSAVVPDTLATHDTSPDIPPQERVSSRGRSIAMAIIVSGAALTAGALWLHRARPVPLPLPEVSAARSGTAALSIRSQRRAQVFINGQALGTTPLPGTLTLPSGPVTIELVSDRQEHVRDDLILPAGAHVVVAVDWKRKRLRATPEP